ncbi:hypothetical protein K1719_011827 [Acacia pycnantha]|nr:hypothetical protein K1719_011827 [Acacia pycnantha]
MGVTTTEWIGVILGCLPLLGFVLWWWNELWYVVLSGRDSNKTLPPGHLGLPFIGDTITFLWYFKFLRRPDDYINAKRRKYGEGEGLFRTHLFGSPSIIACEPLVTKFVLQSSEDKFISEWPNIVLLGSTSLNAVQGKEHSRIRSVVTNAVNRPDALRRIALLIQPRVVAALHSWAHKGRINAYLETKKVTLENIGKLFVSFEPGDLLDSIDELFKGVLNGIRAYPLDFPGTAYHHGLKCKKKLDEIFGKELQKRKKMKVVEPVDLMDGLMQIKDEEGNILSDTEILDNMVSLVVGGYTSTALASMWAIYFLAKFPNVLHRLREENMALRKAKTGEFITAEEISKSKYTNMVVEETLRMGNISLSAFRSTVKEVEYKGYKLPKGWKVIVWLRNLHTDPKNFEDPMCFNPDRWNEPAKPGTYQVFGGGKRICAGNMLARLQLGILLHHLSTGYKWELVNPEDGMVCLPHQKPEDGAEVFFSEL